MYQLEIKLKQHTPLIHFQHDQDGATLRASEVKPKLDKYILTQLGGGDYEKGKAEAKANGWLIGKGDHPALDYKMRIEDSIDNIVSFEINKKQIYKSEQRDKDKNQGYTIIRVKPGDIITDQTKGKIKYEIEDNGLLYRAKKRDSDSRIIYSLTSYPFFFANMDADITDSNEYRKVTYAKAPFVLVIFTKDESLYKHIKSGDIISSFFLNHNFGTRQSKGFGSFYVDKCDPLYVSPRTKYSFSLTIKITEKVEKDFYSLFSDLDLFYKSIRAGINVKSKIKGEMKTVFYFKSLAFMYCKDMLDAEWDKKAVKSYFYFNDSPRRKDCLIAQRKKYPNDDDHDILYFDKNEGYDIRDLLGFSTNEAWQSYKDSITKKVAVLKEGIPNYPSEKDKPTVERMRSPLLIKPIQDDKGITVYLLFQDNVVGITDFKKQLKVCFYSSKEKEGRGQNKLMLLLPEDFSMEGYFDYIFKKLLFNIETHVNEDFHERPEYEILSNIYSQLAKSSVSK